MDTRQTQDTSSVIDRQYRETPINLLPAHLAALQTPQDGGCRDFFLIVLIIICHTWVLFFNTKPIPM